MGVPLGEPLPPSGLPDASDDHRVDLGGEDHVRQRCNKTAERATALLRKLSELPTLALPHLPAAQLSALLLRMCGCGKLTHLLRSTPPSTAREAAVSYDRALLDCYRELAALDAFSPAEASQCQLPLRDGGRGLRSQERLAPAAWLASWAQCLSQVLLRTNLEELTNLETCTLPLAQHCRDALAALPPALPSEREEETTNPLDWREWALRPRKKLQKLLSKRLDEKQHADLLTALDAPERARLHSCAGPLAAAWQWASPGNLGEKLEDEEYCTTARALLGQPVAPAAATCQNRARTGPTAGQPCGEPLCAHANHAHKCPRGGGLKVRSEDVESVLESIHVERGYTVDRQVHVPQWNRWRWRCRPCDRKGTTWDHPGAPCAHCNAAVEVELEEAILDLDVRCARIPRTLIDVTVRYSVPGGERQLADAARGPGAVNHTAELDKRLRYADGRTPWQVVPFAVETCGRLGPAALKHLRGLARARAQGLADGGDAAVSALLLRWAARLSTALHRSNASRLRSALGAAEPARQRARDLAADLAK